MYSRMLVFAAHCDDELAMAGTIALAARDGATVGLITMTDGCEGYPAQNARRSIVARRRREARRSDLALGVRRHYFMAQPDMGLCYKKSLLHDLIGIIRQFKPQAVFTHGPVDTHMDHRQTHRLSVDACWHAGQPVSAALGKIWKITALYYYKGVRPGMDDLPSVGIDVSLTQYKRLEALATQESQMTLFKTTPRELLKKARNLKLNPQPAKETFWLAAENRFDRFPDFLTN